MKLRFIAGYLLGILSMAACAAVEYRRYGLILPAECYDRGTLLGRQGSGGWPDIPFTQCKPDEVVRGKCVIELQDDFFAKDAELRQCRQALKDCETGDIPSG